MFIDSFKCFFIYYILKSWRLLVCLTDCFWTEQYLLEQVSGFRISPLLDQHMSWYIHSINKWILEVLQHTYTLYYSVMVQNDNGDSAGLFVSLCLSKTWPQHEYCKEKTHLSFWSRAVPDVTSKEKKLINEDIFRAYFPELIPLPQESDEIGEKAWVSLGLVEL